ncbi:MAG: MoxR family ATPase [Deltaproteobacteria bacterium]|nr:MoxR family ATPase [Deltaproteobacteria bacterium]
MDAALARERIRAVAAQLDAFVVGHDEAKRALVLALVCREHIYLEGPPGAAKTRMAEVAARAAGLGFFFYQLHRDTRLAELVGDTVLERAPLPSGGERIAQRVLPGGIATAEVCVLDDISRAPGEALNVLLRLLQERKLGDVSIPLLTAIATSNPQRDEYYNEPLDPANLDRFALQLRVPGLLGAEDLAPARELVERAASGALAEDPRASAVCDRGALDAAFAAIARIAVPPRARDALLEALRILRAEYGCDETNSLLTDRTFLVKAVKLLRGSAWLAGRSEVASDDLAVLRWMTTFRVPEEAHEKIEEVIARVA